MDAPTRTLRIGIVDDMGGLNLFLAGNYPDTFDEPNVVCQVLGPEDAWQLLELTPDVILVDGCMADDRGAGRDAMRTLRAHGYGGPLVTISDDSGLRAQMIAAGCVDECAKDDSTLPEIVRRVIDAVKTEDDGEGRRQDEGERRT